MPNKREIPAVLTRTELLDVAARFELQASTRSSKDDLVEAVASSRKATVGEILDGLGRSRLKDICRSLGLDDSGKEKATVIERLVGVNEVRVTPDEDAA